MTTARYAQPRPWAPQCPGRPCKPRQASGCFTPGSNSSARTARTAPALQATPGSGTTVRTRWDLETNSFWDTPLCLDWSLRWRSGLLCGTEKVSGAPLTSHPHLPPAAPWGARWRPTVHCLGSQHRWTQGKEIEQFKYFPQVKSQNMTIKFWKEDPGQSRAGDINSILRKRVLFFSHGSIYTTMLRWIFWLSKVSGCNKICIRRICSDQPQKNMIFQIDKQVTLGSKRIFLRDIRSRRFVRKPPWLRFYIVLCCVLYCYLVLCCVALYCITLCCVVILWIQF